MTKQSKDQEVLMYLICKKCNTKVSNTLKLDRNTCYLDYGVEAGTYKLDDQQNFIINVQDKQGLAYHSEKSRLAGCCGPSPEGKPNLICQCKNEIGREVTDCLTAHFIKIEKESVEVFQDKWNIFSLIKIIEEQNVSLDRIDTFFNLAKYGQERDALKYLKKAVKLIMWFL